MQVLIENGYVTGYAIVGGIVDGIDVEEPSDLEHFEEHYQAYSVIDGRLVCNDEKALKVESDALKQELRERRQAECFVYIDRGKFWYDSLTSEQITELHQWYEEWLNVTETLTIPDKPAWL